VNTKKKIHYFQSGSEYERESKIPSKEARKYIFNCLDDIAQVNLSSNLTGNDRIAEKIDRYWFMVQHSNSSILFLNVIL
jgi:hypothetical protein